MAADANKDTMPQVVVAVWRKMMGTVKKIRNRPLAAVQH
jgi:hypothetical protein